MTPTAEYVNRPENRLSVVESDLLTLREVVRLGPKMAIAYGAWGAEVDNKELVKRYIGEHPQKETFETMIANTGVTTRHQTLPPHPQDLEGREATLNEQIEVGARLTQEALAAVGWDRADLLIGAVSAPLSADIVDQMAVRAGLAGIETKCYSLACNGAIAALHDALQLEQLRGRRVVITAVEGLSMGLNLNPEDINLDSPQGQNLLASAIIFGNGASALAFIPEVSLELIHGITEVVPDEEGVIRVPRIYELPSAKECLEPPSWYDLSTTGAKEKFAYTANRVLMLMPESTSDAIEMNGTQTARLFPRIVAPVVHSVIDQCCQKGLISPETDLLGVFHQPSQGVLEITGRRINMMSRRSGLPKLEIPWVLDEVRMGNVSAATTFLAWAQLQQEGRIPQEKPFNITGFGVGASVTSMMVRTKEG